MEQHQPGDVVRGHRLSADGTTWEPLAGVYWPGSVLPGSARSTHPRGGRWTRPAFVVASVLLAVVTLSGVGVFLQDSYAAADAQRAQDDGPLLAPSPGFSGQPLGPDPTPEASRPTAEDEAPVAEPESSPAVPATVVVTRVIDGDTVEINDGSRVRLIGIDTPEVGQCGYQEASDRLSTLVLGASVALEAGAVDDIDRYGRLLRYVVVDGVDAGEVLLREGLAVPRYNSTDGYGLHAREAVYDEAAEPPLCGQSRESFQFGEAPAAPVGGAEPWNQPGPDLDCVDIGMRVLITGPDYHRLDADGDGWGCEAYR